MKKHVLTLSLIVFVLSFGSCKKDKVDPVADLKQKMIAKWIYDKYQSENYDSNGNLLSAPTVYDQDDAIAYAEFKSDGTQVMTSNGQDFNNDTWTIIDGSHFKLGTYTETVKTIDAHNFVYTDEIVELNGNKTVYTYTLKR